MARVAVVTGGTRGIGEAISVALKNAGYKVAANYAGNDERAKAFSDRTGIAGLQMGRRRFRRLRRRREPRSKRAGSGRRDRQQCRHHPRRHDEEDEPPGLGRGARHQSGRLLQHVQGGLGRHAGPRLRPHRQYRLHQRPGRPIWPGQLRRRQVRHPRLHQGAGARKAPPRASPSTPSRRAISTPTWWRRCRPKCWPRSSPAFRSGGWARPHEIARGVLFLVADDAGFITGSTMSINGGQHMY